MELKVIGRGREVRIAMCFYQVMKWDLEKGLQENWQRGKLVIGHRARSSYDCSERHRCIWKCGKLCEKLSLCFPDGLFVVSAACLSSREVVIKVCCKTCRRKAVGEWVFWAAILGNVLSGIAFWKGYRTCAANWILLKHTSETRPCQDFEVLDSACIVLWF